MAQHCLAEGAIGCCHILVAACSRLIYLLAAVDRPILGIDFLAKFKWLVAKSLVPFPDHEVAATGITLLDRHMEAVKNFPLPGIFFTASSTLPRRCWRCLQTC